MEVKLTYICETRYYQLICATCYSKPFFIRIHNSVLVMLDGLELFHEFSVAICICFVLDLHSIFKLTHVRQFNTMF